MSTTERVPLPSGSWVQLRDPRTLRRGDKQRAMRAVQDKGGDLSQALDLINGLLTVLIIDWGYPFPVPSEAAGSLDLIPLEDDDALNDAVEEARTLLFPGKPDPKDAKDPASPTEPSAA
ncbi:MAG: hypothetical protein HOY79_34050 [Streptomyces sp.]|nr:hypothetical protein [Streptomyces sp.]NUS11419.1 hypothetical protein [Streptomyces sp.]NUS23440.1 hypothetical protein [Streptomyces sp.]